MIQHLRLLVYLSSFDADNISEQKMAYFISGWWMFDDKLEYCLKDFVRNNQYWVDVFLSYWADNHCSF